MPAILCGTEYGISWKLLGWKRHLRSGCSLRTRYLLWCQLCRHWCQSWRLPIWQPAVPPMTTKWVSCKVSIISTLGKTKTCRLCRNLSWIAVVVMHTFLATCSATNVDKVGIMTTLGFQCSTPSWCLLVPLCCQLGADCSRKRAPPHTWNVAPSLTPRSDINTH